MLHRTNLTFVKLWLTHRQNRLISLCVLFLCSCLVLPPLFFIMKGGLHDPASTEWHLSLELLSHIVTQKNFATSVLNSLIFACGSVIFALIVGGMSAFLVARTDAPLKSLTYVISLISLGTPYVLYVSAWLTLLNKSGPFNILWRQWTGASTPLINVYGLGGMIFIEGLLSSPLAFLLLNASFRYANPDFEDAALMSGASQRQIIWRITAPLAAPSILALILLIFIRCIESFEVPSLVGLPGKVHVLTTDVFEYINRTMPPDIDAGNAVALILLLFVMGLLFVYQYLTRHIGQYASVVGRNFRPRLIKLGQWRWFAGAFLGLNFLCAVILPFMILVWLALSPFYTALSWAAFERLTFINFDHIFHSTRYIELITTTLLLACVSASCVILTTFYASWVIVRKGYGAALLNLLATLPLGFPGIVLAVGTMQFFLSLPVGLYGTSAIIMWAFCIAYLPYGLRYCIAGLMHMHQELEEAARVSGASTHKILWRITRPILTPSLIAGWVFIFLISTRALSVPIILSSATTQPLAVAMFDLWGNGQSPELAALGLLWASVMGVVAYALHHITEKTGLNLRG